MNSYELRNCLYKLKMARWLFHSGAVAKEENLFNEQSIMTFIPIASI
jgi:hypothetical protein